VFAGIRPLVRSGDARSTASLSRDHTIHIDPSGLLTLTGGKWTTYRNMAEDAVNQAATLARLPDRDCPTRTLNVHGFHPAASKFGPLHVYGSDALVVEEIAQADPSLAEPLHPDLATIGAEIVFAARHEMARTVEDALARRTRALFLDAGAAAALAPRVAELMARELGRDESWRDAQVQAFRELAAGYRLEPLAADTRPAG
jgi:glycerol-3-phosphate dehydrogenase